MSRIKNTFSFQVAAVVALLAITFALFEGVVAGAQVTTLSEEFIVQQTITGELAFVTTPNDVTMDTPIAALTGGTSNGSTVVAIQTNESAGYNMTIQFEDDPAMQRDAGGGFINDYSVASAGVPDYSFSTATAAGEFGYSVVSAVAADADPTFRNNGTACNTGALSTAGQCWMEPDDVAETIVDRTTATGAGGATTTLNFRVFVPPNPTPALPSGQYTATATLTATTN